MKMEEEKTKRQKQIFWFYESMNTSKNVACDYFIVY